MMEFRNGGHGDGQRKKENFISQRDDSGVYRLLCPDEYFHPLPFHTGRISYQPGCKRRSGLYTIGKYTFSFNNIFI